MPTATYLTPAELPLVLLACVAHPEQAYRKDLRHRLDVALQARKPRRTIRSLEAFFARQARRLGGTWLSGALRELAVLVARVAFSGRPTAPRRMLIAPDDDHLTLGCVVTDDLEVTTLARSAIARHRALQQKEDYRFLPELAGKRLDRWPGASDGVTAVCRAEGGLVLDLTAASAWPTDFTGVRLPGARVEAPPAALGFEQKRHGDVIRLFPRTPEATVRFSAWLAAGRGLILEQPRRWVGVRLRDFDGERITLPVISAARPDETEPWLIGLPSVRMTLGDDDRLALSGWAYPLASWLTDSFVERLV